MHVGCGCRTTQHGKAAVTPQSGPGYLGKGTGASGATMFCCLSWVVVTWVRVLVKLEIAVSCTLMCVY